MPQIITIGELLIDFISIDQDASLKESSGFIKAPGGAPANVACGVARLGEDVGFIGKVGNDPFGVYLQSVLQYEGVNTDCMLFDNNARTTLSFVALKSDGVRDCMFYRNPGADLLLAPQEIQPTYFKNVNILAYGSNSLTSTSAFNATMQAIAYAKKEGALIAYDPNLRISLWDDLNLAKERIIDGFQHADLVKISDEEFPFITGLKTPEECANYIHSLGCKLVVISLGAKGCYYSLNDKTGYCKGKRVKAIETTGAGDAFFSALLCRYNQKLNNKDIAVFDSFDIEEIVEFANTAGALATTKMGAIPALPTLNEINAAISNEEL